MLKELSEIHAGEMLFIDMLRHVVNPTLRRPIMTFVYLQISSQADKDNCMLKVH